MIGQDPMAHDGNVEGGLTISSWKRERKKCFYCPFVSDLTGNSPPPLRRWTYIKQFRNQTVSTFCRLMKSEVACQEETMRWNRGVTRINFFNSSNMSAIAAILVTLSDVYDGELTEQLPRCCRWCKKRYNSNARKLLSVSENTFI